MNISNCVFNLLKDHDCVTIPGFGSFICQIDSAKISVDGTKIFPPSKRIVFNKLLTSDDGLLTKYISEKQGVSYNHSKKTLKVWTKKRIKKLKKIGFFKINKVGEINFNDGNYRFIPSLNSNLLSSSYGLEVVGLKPVKEKQNRQLPPFIKYAATLVILLGIFVSLWDSYSKSVVEYNNNSFTVANEQINKKIQTATFSIRPSFPVSKVNVSQRQNRIFIIAGAFRNKNNAKKMVLRLKNNGFNNAREIGLNKYNLTQVAYNSYISIDEANNELIKIRKTMDESAWILIKK